MLCHMQGVLDADALEKANGLLAEISFKDGAASAGFRARRVKRNEQSAANSQQRALQDLVLDSLESHDRFQRAALPLILRAPLISRYQPGMHYGPHVDDAVMGRGDPVRTDVSVTVFLSEPEDYDGGELVLASPFGETRVKLPRGDAVIYPSNTVHEVAPVTRGERVAAVTWVQSKVRDASQREILWDLYQVANALHRQAPDGAETTLAFKSYSNLLRMWAET
jgi:PKHD-type hydroxylase